jgi:HPt (histidine-containing phosphotransfer) domain-containing protein
VNRETETIIDGVNVKKGILLSGGCIEHYYKSLAMFSDNAHMLSDEIKKSLESGNTSSYVTHVRSLKDALAHIGADVFSKVASALEAAGCQEDVAFLNRNSNEFLVILHQLLGNIQKVLISSRINSVEKRIG